MADVLIDNSVRDFARDDRSDTTYLSTVLRRTSWGAVVAGAVVAISSQMILTVLGITLGITAADLTSDPNVRIHTGVQITAAVWWLVTGTISLFIGGCVVGRFAAMGRGTDVLLHAFTMWSVTALFGFLAVTAGAGALYGSGMSTTYAGAQASGTDEAASRGDVNLLNEHRDSTSGAQRTVTEEEAARYVRIASMWTLFGLLFGVGASLAGSWISAPERIVVQQPGQRRPVVA